MRSSAGKLQFSKSSAPKWVSVGPHDEADKSNQANRPYVKKETDTYERICIGIGRGGIMAKLNAAKREQIPTTTFAFPKQRKEPLENASHVRNAAARFNQVEGVTEAERRAAWKRIQSAAKRFGVELKEAA
jgi:hypothetical protein